MFSHLTMSARWWICLEECLIFKPYVFFSGSKAMANFTIMTWYFHQLQQCNSLSKTSWVTVQRRYLVLFSEQKQVRALSLMGGYYQHCVEQAQPAQHQSIKVVLTMDSAMMTWNLNVVMMDLKETEAMATMPLLGSHLLKWGNNEDADDDGELGIQSCFHCIPLKCMFGPESKDVIKKTSSQNMTTYCRQQCQTASEKTSGFQTGSLLTCFILLIKNSCGLQWEQVVQQR